MEQDRNQATKKQNDSQDNYEIGKAFEEYIYKLFNNKVFKVEQWLKAEKFPEGLYKPGHSNPDLHLIFNGKYKFAVECKWRKEFIDGKINWADPSKIRRYQKFQNRNRIPVFIAIGIGGTSSSPDRLFVTPLDHISMFPTVFESRLIPFKRKPTRKLFYDAIQFKLF